MGRGFRLRFICLVVAVGATVSVLTLTWCRWRADAPRRHALQALSCFCDALKTGDRETLLQTVAATASIAGHTPTEQVEFVTRALQDEISSDGLATLRRQGQFGPLRKLFPHDAEKWAQQAGVPADQCYAFRLDPPNGLRTEVVLHKNGEHIRIVRCNNVR